MAVWEKKRNFVCQIELKQNLMSVIIKEVQSRKDLRDFVRFPIRLYKDCPHYVPNLYLDEMHALTEKNPMTRYSKTAKFLAYKDGELCGRVMAIINEIADHKFWDTATLSRLEWVRKEIRELVQFILGTDNRTFTINIEDAVVDGGMSRGAAPTMTYKQRVIDYLAKNRDLPVLDKIFKMEKLEVNDIEELERILWEELGTKEEYLRYVEKGNMICGDSVGAFIRAQIGVDRVVAVERFGKFLSGASLNTMQEEYLKTIITYVCENGDITTGTLVNTSPFSEYDWVAIFGQNLISVRDYVNNLHNIIIPSSARLRA